MSLEKLLRELVREEVERLVAPLHDSVAELEGQMSVVARLTAALSGGKRGPGRPPKLLSLVSGVGRRRGPSGRRGTGEASRGCALIGCRNPSRSKGYCAAHYQKWRNLSKTNRLPADWVADAEPHTVKNVPLPRGRAGAKALAEAKKK